MVDEDGTSDVLDQLGDRPDKTDKISVYRLTGDVGEVHINFGSSSKTGFYATAKYRHLDQVDGESFRDTDTWREWVGLQFGGKIDMETGMLE